MSLIWLISFIWSNIAARSSYQMQTHGIANLMTLSFQFLEFFSDNKNKQTRNLFLILLK